MSKGYANFYHGDRCLFSIRCSTERAAEKLSVGVYQEHEEVDDWTYTDEPMGNVT